ncbi:hypothetical protein V6U89_29855 [Micromonospora sp. CPCC 206171]|uniref:hypothetical protein n=1 Tax=Micromonospora sp. CPCC 206171 TaxID=3122405 RepID=UPI002FF1D828
MLVTTKVDTTTTSGDVVLMEWETPEGTFVKWRLVSLAIGTTQLIAYNASGAATVVLDRGSQRTSFDTFAVSAYQSGGNINVALYTSSSGEPTGSVAGTLTGITRITVNPTGATCTVDMPFGHLTVWSTSSPPLQMGAALDSHGRFVWDALRSHVSETATVRLNRLAAEDGFSLTMPTVSAEFIQRMGWQPVATGLSLYQQTEDADQGMLYEDGFGLGYLPREFRYNPTVALALDYDQGHIAEPPEPTDDDQQLRNRWTVSRTEGSSAVAQDADSIATVGLFDSSIQVNHNNDATLADHANWRVHLGTVDEMRWPKISLNLARSPGLITQWLSCSIGSRITIANLPSQVAGDAVDLIIEGYSETFSEYEWTVELNCSPAKPWLIAEADGSARVDSDSSALAGDITSSATSLQVTSEPFDVWTTSASDLPIPILVGGERMTVSAIGPPARLNEEALFESKVSPWTSPDGAGVTHSTVRAHSGTGSMLLTPTGGTSLARVETELMPIVATHRFTGTAWVWCSVARTVDLYIAWFNGTTFISSEISSPSISASTWVPLGIGLPRTAPEGATQARFGIRLAGTPPVGHTLWIDEAFFFGVDQQTFTVVRSVNGISKSHLAGTPVRVANPAVVAL